MFEDVSKLVDVPDGMEAQAISGATTSDRGINTGRGFDFNVFASELFNNLVVRKTADAERYLGIARDWPGRRRRACSTSPPGRPS